MYTIQVFNNTNGSNKTVHVLPGETVADALNKAGVSPEGAMVRVNQAAAGLDTTLGDGDRISVTKQGLKGAQMRTFQDLLTSRPNCQAAGNELVAAAQAKRDEESKKKLVRVYTDLLAEADTLERSTEISVAELGRKLAQAQEHFDKVTYVLGELRDGNPFPYYALLGKKDMAQSLCEALGVLVPENDSTCWNTTPEGDAPAVQG